MHRTTHEIQARSPVQILLNTVSRAIHKVRRATEVQEELQQASLLLETMPLSIDQSALARNYLQSAGRYVRSCEYGSACWELGTLRRYILGGIGLDDRALY